MHADRPAFASAFRWAGAILFFASLAYFLFTYMTTFGIAAVGAPSSSAITWNVALFTIFALHHSVFARTGIRGWVSRTFPPELERSIYVWVASILFILVCALWRPVPGVVWNVTGPAAWASLALQAAGVWLTLRSAVALDVRHFAGLRPAARAVSGSPGTTEFKTTGPYGWVRHPIYAGWFLMVLPTPVMTMTRLVFVAVSCAYLLMAIPLEERTMRASPDGGYDRYMRKVRWRLVPGLY